MIEAYSRSEEEREKAKEEGAIATVAAARMPLGVAGGEEGAHTAVGPLGSINGGPPGHPGGATMRISVVPDDASPGATIGDTPRPTAPVPASPIPGGGGGWGGGGGALGKTLSGLSAATAATEVAGTPGGSRGTVRRMTTFALRYNRELFDDIGDDGDGVPAVTPRVIASPRPGGAPGTPGVAAPPPAAIRAGSGFGGGGGPPRPPSVYGVSAEELALLEQALRRQEEALMARRERSNTLGSNGSGGGTVVGGGAGLSFAESGGDAAGDATGAR